MGRKVEAEALFSIPGLWLHGALNFNCAGSASTQPPTVDELRLRVVWSHLACLQQRCPQGLAVHGGHFFTFEEYAMGDKRAAAPTGV
jgi:hypothetical protein